LTGGFFFFVVDGVVNTMKQKCTDLWSENSSPVLVVDFFLLRHYVTLISSMATILFDGSIYSVNRKQVTSLL
jgi:hypothetical protein